MTRMNYHYDISGAEGQRSPFSENALVLVESRQQKSLLQRRRQSALFR